MRLSARSIRTHPPFPYTPLVRSLVVNTRRQRGRWNLRRRRVHRDATVRLRSQLVDVLAHAVRLQLVFLAPGLLVAVQQPVHRAAVGIPGMAPSDEQERKSVV